MAFTDKIKTVALPTPISTGGQGAGSAHQDSPSSPVDRDRLVLKPGQLFGSRSPYVTVFSFFFFYRAEELTGAGTWPREQCSPLAAMDGGDSGTRKKAQQGRVCQYRVRSLSL